MEMSSENQAADDIRLGEYYDIGHGRLRIYEDRLKSGKLVTTGGIELTYGLVADGVGGAGAGEAASQAVVDTVSAFLQTSRETNLLSLVQDALDQAHKSVRAVATENPALRAMSTTATLALVHNGMLYLAHIGDSRAYLVRGKQIIQLTLDHSWGNEMVRQGRFRPDEVSKHPKRDELARYIGQPAHLPLEIDAGYRWLEPDSLDPHPAKSELQTSPLPLRPGDVVLLCSDGLIKERHNGKGHYIEPSEIVDEIQHPHQDANVLARMLASRALGRQADDNVSVVVLELPGGEKLIAPSVQSALAGALRKDHVSGGKPSGLSQKNIMLGLIGAIILVFIGVAGILLKPSGQDNQALSITNPMQSTPTSIQLSLMGSNEIGQVLQLDGVIEYQLPGGEKTLLNKNDPLAFVPGLNIYSKPGGFLKLEMEPDQMLVLSGESAVKVESLASQDNTGSTATILTIESGQVLVKGPFWVINAAQREFKAEGQDALFGVFFEPASGNFSLDCLEGKCRLGDKTLEAGYQLGYVDGILQSEPRLADYNAWSLLAPGLIPQPTQTPTPTPTSTPTETPTPTSTPVSGVNSDPTVTPRPKDPKKPSDDNPPPVATTESPEPSEEPTEEPADPGGG